MMKLTARAPRHAAPQLTPQHDRKASSVQAARPPRGAHRPAVRFAYSTPLSGRRDGTALYFREATSARQIARQLTSGPFDRCIFNLFLLPCDLVAR